MISRAVIHISYFMLVPTKGNTSNYLISNKTNHLKKSKYDLANYLHINNKTGKHIVKISGSSKLPSFNAIKNMIHYINISTTTFLFKTLSSTLIGITKVLLIH